MDRIRSSSPADFDVIIASDLRFPGGTSHSIAEEVAAQHAAGYRTALAHLNGPMVRRLHPINRQIRHQVDSGAAELLVGRAPVRTRLLVLRHPAVAQSALAQLPPLEAECVVVVANAGPDNIDGRRHYDPELVDEQVAHHLGCLPLWAPIGPLVREEIAPLVPHDGLSSRDWVNIIDVDQWAVDRPTWHGPTPVVGRHSRPSPQKWPEDAETIRQVYPTDGSWDVRILGGAYPAEQVLGSIPQAWTVLPFGALPAREFLAGLDFFVYYHDSRWVEAFGRTILEAIASGLPAVVPPHFETLFGPAALYAEPADARALVESLRNDRDRYDQHVQQARVQVRNRFGYEAHQARLNELIGSPRPPERTQVRVSQPGVSPPRPARLPPSPAHPRVVLVSSNGSGMGHLTRLLAYARRMQGRAWPYFLSMSQAVPVVARFGFGYEYLPSPKAIGMPPGVWQEMFVDRVSECLRRVGADVVVFDGTWPYNGIPAIRERFPQLRWVWSRRGMWRHGVNTEQIAKSEWFDEVIEPGDFAAPQDHGITRTAQATRLRPVTLLDQDEAQTRDEARRDLDLSSTSPTALISLGAGNINDTTDDTGAATAALVNLGVEVCVTQPEIAASALDRLGVRLIHDYPLARHYAAFDVVISATGYNSFQELMRMGVPSLLVPNTQTALDDQAARADYAAAQGWAHTLDHLTVETAEPLLADLLQNGPRMAKAAQASDPGNGAQDGAEVILRVATRPSQRSA